MKAIQKREHKYKEKDNDTEKARKTYAIFLKSWWLTHSKYDDRYLTLAILFTPVTLVTLFRSYNQFYRAECITVSGFFIVLSHRTYYFFPCLIKIGKIDGPWLPKTYF